jgi:hypothetical protein
MEENGKRRLAVAGAVAAGLVYFLVCAIPLPKELVLVPAWSRNLSQAPVAPASSAQVSKKSGAAAAVARQAKADAPIPFRLGERYGYFTDEGSILFAATADYGVALAPDAFATYDHLSDGFIIKSPSGDDLSHVATTGYPFFAAGRRFVIGPDQAAVSELSKNGTMAWTYQFPSIVTAFDASPSVAVFGLLDGSIVGLDDFGNTVLDFAPGGSRIAGVYGVAASPDGRMVAAVTGADKQRLIVLEKRSSAYRVTYHRYLSSDYRRPVYIAFTPDGKRLAYESPTGVGVYDVSRRIESVVAVPASSRFGQTTMGGELMVFLSGYGTDKRLVCTAMPDRRVVDVPVKASLAFVGTKGDSLFLGLDDQILRMDFKER